MELDSKAITTAKGLVAQTAALVAKVRAARASARDNRQASRRIRFQGRLLRGASAHELVPLELAVRAVFTRVYKERYLLGTAARATAHLDGLAYTLAEMASIYVYQEDGNDRRKLSESELQAGLFRDGAKELYYLDGRPTIRNLAVNVSAIDLVARALSAHSFGEDS